MIPDLDLLGENSDRTTEHGLHVICVAVVVLRDDDGRRVDGELAAGEGVPGLGAGGGAYVAAVYCVISVGSLEGYCVV